VELSRVFRLNHLNKKYYLWALISSSILAYFIVSKIIPPAGVFDGLGIISIVVMIDGLLIGLFVTYGWKWRFFYDWFVPFPDLNGTWKGEINSNYIDENTGKKIEKIEVELKIRQSFVHTHCLLETKTMESRSFVAQFDINKEEQRLKLVYSYSGEPIASSKDTNPSHFGTAMLNIEDKGTTLKGSYWTDRETTGELIFKKKL